MSVDIIVPAYHGHYLHETLASCMKQSFRDYQVTVVDNNSPNDIKSICDQFPKVNYIRSPENNGPSGARNFGIQNTKRPYISFIDDDDIMHQDKLLYSMEEFKRNPRLGMTCGNYKILVNGRLRPQFYKQSINVNHNALMRINYVASGSTTVKREVVEDIGLFDERFWIAEDYNYWLRISEKYRIKYIHKVLYYYRIVPGSNSLTQRSDIQKTHLENIEIIKKESRDRMNAKKN
jgi:glycosyltransferase involved in cell wall biosynthesis